MPSITCPYCQTVSASKFIHKAHIREMHAEHFNRNISTCITGAKHELAPVRSQAREVKELGLIVFDSVEPVEQGLKFWFRVGEVRMNFVLGFEKAAIVPGGNVVLVDVTQSVSKTERPSTIYEDELD